VKRGPRYEAQLAGRPKYTTDRPCKLGHLSERITATGTCIECRRLKERQRYADNPAKHVKKTKVWYTKSADKAKARRIADYWANPDKHREMGRKSAAARRKRLGTAIVEYERPFKQRWKQENPLKVQALGAKRRAAVIRRLPKWADLKAIEVFYENRPAGMEVDHVVPLQGKTVSGLHVEYNLQYLTPTENYRKNNRWTAD
jgi:5-methylcytosine-specific restriction endonuclease McrA